MLDSLNTMYLAPAFVSLVFFGLSFTKLGRKKLFVFVAGVFYGITAIAYSVKAGVGANLVSLVLVVAWFVVGLLTFVRIIWFTKD